MTHVPMLLTKRAYQEREPLFACPACRIRSTTIISRKPFAHRRPFIVGVDLTLSMPLSCGTEEEKYRGYMRDRHSLRCSKTTKPAPATLLSPSVITRRETITLAVAHDSEKRTRCPPLGAGTWVL